MSRNSRLCQKKTTLLLEGQNQKSKTCKSCLNILPLICMSYFFKFWPVREVLFFFWRHFLMNFARKCFSAPIVKHRENQKLQSFVCLTLEMGCWDKIHSEYTFKCLNLDTSKMGKICHESWLGPWNATYLKKKVKSSMNLWTYENVRKRTWPATKCPPN